MGHASSHAHGALAAAVDELPACTGGRARQAVLDRGMHAALVLARSSEDRGDAGRAAAYPAVARALAGIAPQQPIAPVATALRRALSAMEAPDPAGRVDRALGTARVSPAHGMRRPLV